MDKKSVLKNIINKGKDVASDVVSYLGTNRLASEIRTKKANNLADLIKKARGYDNAPNENLDGSPSDAYKTRFMKDVLVKRYQDRIKKGKKPFSVLPSSWEL